jgi:tetratricopeptide (TPR) repeat protein
MATVYLAEDLKLHRKVALKVLRPELASALGPDRFLQEIDIAAKLNHPHILGLFDCGEADGFLYYVMPYVEGQSLRDKLAKEGELPIAETVRILRDVVEALKHAHKHNVIHRDIKPDNVLLSERHALVADFGVAKAVSEATGIHSLTTEGVALGTPAYMSPEQAAADKHIDHRADIYAVGAVAYELLTGRTPFTGTTQQELLAAHVTQTPDPVTKYRDSVSPGLEQLVMKCLKKKAADRWQTAEEMLPQLETLATPSGGTTPTEQVPVKRRSSWWIPTVAAIPLSLLAVLYFALPRDTAPTLQSGLLAIFPLENRTGDPSLDHLGRLAADKMAEGLTRVGIVSAVPVSSAEQALEAEPEGAPLHEVAARLEAVYAISGYYTTQAENLVFRVDAVETTTGEHLAALESPPGDASNPAVVLDSLQQRFVISTMLALAGVDINSLRRLPSYEVAAVHLQGVALFQERDFAGAARQYLEAHRMDNTYVRPLLAALYAYGNMGSWRSVDSLLPIVAPHRAEFSRSEAHAIDGFSARVRGDLEGVHQVNRMRLDIDSNSATLHNFAASALSTGRARVALDALEQMDADDPTALPWWDHWYAKASAYLWLGRPEESLEAARTGKSRFPERLRMRLYEMRALIAAGRLDEIGRLLDEVGWMEPNDDYPPAGVYVDVALALARHGHVAESRALAERAVAWYRARDPEHYRKWTAQALLLAGHLDEALEVIRPLVEETPDSIGRRGIYCVALAMTGDTAGAEAQAAWFEQLDRPYLFGEDTRWRAIILAHLGRTDEAVLLLRQAYREGRARDLMYYDVNLMPLWGHEQFEQLIAPRG